MSDHEENTEEQTIKIHTRIISTEYQVQLGDTIDDAYKYNELTFKLRTAGPEDVFYFYLNNFGGQLHTGIAIINAIRASQAMIHMVVSGPVYSMASILALCGDIVQVESNVVFMFHNYSSAEEGKGNEIAGSIESSNQHFKELLLDTCIPFLTKQEINNILKGQDLHIVNKEIQKRLESCSVPEAKNE